MITSNTFFSLRQVENPNLTISSCHVNFAIDNQRRIGDFNPDIVHPVTPARSGIATDETADSWQRWPSSMATETVR